MKTTPVIREDLTTVSSITTNLARGRPTQTLVSLALEPELLRYDPVAITAYRHKPLKLQYCCHRLFGLRLWWDGQRGRTAENQRRRAIQLRELLTRWDLKNWTSPVYPTGSSSSLYPGATQLQDQPLSNEVAHQFKKNLVIVESSTPNYCSRLPRAGVQGS